MKKYLISLALALTLIVGVSQAKAVTMEELMAELATLKQELSSLKSSMSALTLSGYLNTDSTLKATTTTNLTATKTIAPTTVTATTISPLTTTVITNTQLEDLELSKRKCRRLGGTIGEVWDGRTFLRYECNIPGDIMTIAPDYISPSIIVGATDTEPDISKRRCLRLGGKVIPVDDTSWYCNVIIVTRLNAYYDATLGPKDPNATGTPLSLAKTTSTTLTSTPKTIVQTLDQSPCPSTNPDCKSVMPKQVAITNNTNTTQGLTLSKNLSYGLMNDIEVKKLQDFLIQEGYLQAGLNSGNYLGKTVSALQAFQKANNIQGNGRSVGPMTRNALLGTRPVGNTTLLARRCNPTDAPWIQVTSPNGNEVYTAGQQITVTWKSCNLPVTTMIALNTLYDPIQQGSFGMQNQQNSLVFQNDGNEIVTLPIPSTLSGWQNGKFFKVKVLATFDPSNPNSQFLEDSSDNLFTINAPRSVGTSTSNGVPLCSNGMTLASNCTVLPPAEGKIYLLGGQRGYRYSGSNGSSNLAMETLNDVWTSLDGINWTQITNNAPWSKRSHFTGTYFDGKIYVIGGLYGNLPPGGTYQPTTFPNDMWATSDGINWNKIIPSSSTISARQSHSAVVFKDKIWVIGGLATSPNLPYSQTTSEGPIIFCDAWSSSDGINWTQMGENTPCIAQHTAVVLDNKIWLIGNLKSWWSSDGIYWNEVTQNINNRGFSSSVVYNNKIWKMAGNGPLGNLNDVWNSSNGINWTQLIQQAPWDERNGHSLIAFMNKVWILGGRGNDESSLNDVWNSANGINWTQVINNAPWPTRDNYPIVITPTTF